MTGRFVNNSICKSHRFQALNSDSSRLSYLLLLTHAHADGRLDGDPYYLKSLLYPRRPDVTVSDVILHLSYMADAGLIRRYDYAGGTRQAIQIEKFAENQPFTRPGQERPSGIPAPPKEEPTDQNSGLCEALDPAITEPLLAGFEKAAKGG